MEEWKNYKKQKPPGDGPAANLARTERLVAEMRANLTKRKAASRGREADPQGGNQPDPKPNAKPTAKADAKADAKPVDKPKVTR